MTPKVPAAALNVRLIRIIKWNDGKYRAEIQSGLSDKSHFFKPGEVFEIYKVMSIDPDMNTVTLYSSTSDGTFVLQPVSSS